jgi:opacity protein-like surface antigen
MNYLMKSSIATLALCAVVAAHANKGAVYHAPAAEKISFKDGVYVAGYAGAQWSNFSWHGQGDATAVDGYIYENYPLNGYNYDVYSLDGNSGTTEFVGAVALGYQLVNERLYLGFEVAGTFDGTSDSEASYNNTFLEIYEGRDEFGGYNSVMAKATLQGSEVDVDIKPGYIVNDNFLIYARIGAAFNRLKMESSGDWYETSINQDVDFASEAYDSNSTSKNVVGIRLGAGMEYLVTEHFGISVDYLYTDYGTVHSSVSASDIDEGFYQHISNGSNYSEVHVTTQTAMLGLLYHF